MPQDLPPRAAIRRAACVLGVAACALAATGPGAAGGPIARRCLAGGTPLVAGRQALLVRGAAAPEGPAWASCFGAPIAFGAIEGGYFVSTRVFNLKG